ncbi:hypothetical protein VNO80_03040 [Phaseolus coccineus]|uniref:Uncharacterized protein n=1 Tax=Phaseolus coccineus TaxID=3886 RepID=A0AAN9RNA6_PHACN
MERGSGYGRRRRRKGSAVCVLCESRERIWSFPVTWRFGIRKGAVTWLRSPYSPMVGDSSSMTSLPHLTHQLSSPVLRPRQMDHPNQIHKMGSFY